MFCKHKDPIPKNDQSDVYKITCGDCGAIYRYIGGTGRQLKIRIREYFDAFHDNCPMKSAFAAHLTKYGNCVEKATVSLLHTETIKNGSRALETSEIEKHTQSS